jgi:NAD(P)-dependent dehydrogenase (short-subunit alcohol dehydrogenase family)
MKTVLITGAGHGIGFTLAHLMDKLGWSVISAVHSIGGAPGLPGKVIEMDISSTTSVSDAASKVSGLDVLVNNAVHKNFTIDRDILSVSPEFVLTSLNVNVVGIIRVSQAFSPMIIANTGRIVNVTSIWGQLVNIQNSPPMAHPAYKISKTAVSMVTGLLAASLKDRGISVNCVCPSGGRTPETAAEEIAWAVSELEQSETGKFFHCRQAVAW